jgi:hypothetical protein
MKAIATAAIVFGLVALVNARAFEPPETDRLEPKVQAVLRASDLPRAGEAFRALFQAAGNDGLAQLKLHSSDTIAIQAAWREVVRTVVVILRLMETPCSRMFSVKR